MSQTRPAGRRHSAPTPALLLVLAHLPADTWTSSTDVAQALSSTLGIADCTQVAGAPVGSLLRGLRRRGWALYDPAHPGTYRRTPTGTAAIAGHAAAAT